MSPVTRSELHVENLPQSRDIYRDGTYLERNRTWHAEDSPWKAQQIRRLMARNNLTPRTIGEVGCGAGEILRQLAAALPDARFSGYETSPQAYELCKTRQSERVQYHCRNIVEENVSFDCLLCIDVFEHVDDYIGFLRSLRAKATYKIFHIPLDISVLAVLRGTLMTARDSVGHLHYFTAETALATLRDSGYEIVDNFFTTSFDDLPPRHFKARLARIPRRVLYVLSPRFMVRLLGGCSLIVLAR